MKRTELHSLESVAVSVAFFAAVVCTLAANGDSLSGGPANFGSSQASTEQSTSASAQSQSEAVTNRSSQAGGSVQADSNSGFTDKTHSEATVLNTELKGVPLGGTSVSTTSTRPTANKTYTRKSGGSGIGKSSAWMTHEINGIAKPQRRVVKRSSKRQIASARRSRRGKSWKVVNYNWSNGSRKTSYVKGSNLAR
jgi:hypothetical protein